MSIELVLLSNHLTLCCPLLLLPSIFPSIRVFSNVLSLPVTWPKYWSFSISPCNEYSGLISFRINWIKNKYRKREANIAHGHPRWLRGKESACKAGDTGGAGSFPGSGRSPGEGNGYPLQYSCLENPREEETCRLQTMGSQRVRHD